MNVTNWLGSQQHIEIIQYKWNFKTRFTLAAVYGMFKVSKILKFTSTKS